MIYSFYIIESGKNGKFYIGQTKDINDRLKRHNNGESLVTKYGIPWRLIKLENFNTRTEAIKRERYLKSLKNKNYLKDRIIDYSGVEK
jgi:putative endonuclease